jgi:PadR family transcriptional regulator
MSRENALPPTVEFRHGAIELLLLKALSWGPQHGFSIARWIQDTADDVLRLEEGSMYPALRRMEDKGWVKATWGTSANNRRAKYYELTAAGRAHLTADERDWWRYAEAVGRVLRSTAKPVPA